MASYLLVTLLCGIAHVLQAARLPATTGELVHLKAGDGNMISSANWPNGSYSPNTAMRWTLFAEPGNVVQFHFEEPFDLAEAELGSCYDYVQVISCKFVDQLGSTCSNTVPTIARVCGTKPPADILSDSECAVLEFCSDSDPSKGHGFGVMVSGVPAPTQAPTPSSHNCGVQSPNFPVKNLTLTRIVGGNHANPHSWPWAAALFTGDDDFNYQFCGGSLINKRWVLTAGHCFGDGVNLKNLEGFKVKLGADNKGESWDQNEDTQQVVEIEQAFVNPQFDPDTVTHDTTLLKLAQDVTINDYVRPVCLPSSNDKLPDGAEVIVIGWGTTSYQGDDSPVLLQVQLPIVNHQTCTTEYKAIQDVVDDTMICAGLAQGGKDSCQGDSGGPLLQNRNGVWYLEGTVSWGQQCALPGFPGVYGYVATMMDWITTTIKENS